MKRQAGQIRAIAVLLTLDLALQPPEAVGREKAHGGTAARIEQINPEEPLPVLEGPPGSARTADSLFGPAIQRQTNGGWQMPQDGGTSGIQPINPLNSAGILPPPPKKLRLDGSISASAVYIDNIFISGTRKVDDLVLSILPSLSLTAGSPATDRSGYLALKYAPGYIHFAKNNMEDTFTHDAQLNAGYQFTRLRLALRLDYRQWRGADPDVGTRLDRRDFLVALMSNYDLTERSSVELNLSRNSSDYAGFRNVSDMIAQGYFNFRITEAITLGLGVAHGRAEVDRTSAQDYGQVTFRAGYRATERINVSANVGVDLRDTGGGSRTTPVFGLEAHYNPTDSTDIHLKGSRSVAPSAVFRGQDRRATYFFAAVRQRFLQRYFLTPSITYDHVEFNGTDADSTAGRTDDLITLGVSAETNITERWSLESFYRHRRNTSTLDRFNFSSQEIGFASSVSF